MKRAFFPFFMMFLLALSFGLGSYYLTALQFIHAEKTENSTLFIPQSDIDEDVDVVRALLTSHAADYFVYRGTPIGFQYDMLKELERGLGRNVDIRVEKEHDIILKELYNGNYDIVIMDFTPHGFYLPFIERSIPHSYSYPVLVAGNDTDNTENELIIVSDDFPALKFFAQDSPFFSYPVQICHDFSSEELFEKVDNGELPFLICDYNEAITLLPFYNNVQILEKAGPFFERRWLLNKKNLQLNEDIDHWLLDFKKTTRYDYFLRKYFTPESSFISSMYAKKQQGDISKYDAIIKKYARQYGFDWRYVASIIFQETKFIPGLTGKGGSYGLMQLMPVTMDYYGISPDDGEEVIIQTGIKHLNLIRKSFNEIKDEDEKLFFVAAAYNAGRGHIFDAQRLCAKYEEDFMKWKNVSKYLVLKSKREYKNDPLIKSGYFPGAYTVKYTQKVMERYNMYKVAYQ